MSISAMSHPCNGVYTPSSLPDTHLAMSTEPLVRLLQNIAPRLSESPLLSNLPAIDSFSWASPVDHVQPTTTASNTMHSTSTHPSPPRSTQHTIDPLLSRQSHAPEDLRSLHQATVALDHVLTEQLRKHLVKDVFFSPAMTDCSSVLPSGALSDTDSDSRADDDDAFSTPMTPSDLLLESDTSGDLLHFFCLDHAAAAEVSTGLLADLAAKERSTQLYTRKSPIYVNLPTPPALALEDDDSDDNSTSSGSTNSTNSHTVSLTGSLKRKHVSLASAGNRRKKRDTWQLSSPLSSPPTSPVVDDYFSLSSDEEDDHNDEDHYFGDVDNSEDKVGGHGRNLPITISRDMDAKRTGSLVTGGEINIDDDGPDSAFSWSDVHTSAFGDDSDEDDHSDFEEIVDKYEDACSQVDKALDGDAGDSHGDKNGCCLAEASPRPTTSPTLYQTLTMANIDWCRYCGTTEGVNWRPGPWGKRTLCNKHGCDYKGYGFACKLPRLDLTGFVHESINDRDRPVLQLYCSCCHHSESWQGNVLVRCEGCPKAYHRKCAPTELTDAFIDSSTPWFCESTCRENVRRKRVVVELPRKRLPLMCTPKPSGTSTVEMRSTRSLRDQR